MTNQIIEILPLVSELLEHAEAVLLATTGLVIAFRRRSKRRGKNGA